MKSAYGKDRTAPKMPRKKQAPKPRKKKPQNGGWSMAKKSKR